MARMRYVRAVDEADPILTDSSAHRARLVSYLESALMVSHRLEAGGSDGGLHYRRSDTLLYVTEGTLRAQLGDEEHVVESGSLVLVPGGVAHTVANDGPTESHHLELVVPTPSPLTQPTVAVGSSTDVPPDDRTDRPASVRPVDATSLTETLPGMHTQALAVPESGSDHAVVFYVEVGAGDAGPATHIHVFDQYYLVLEGQLTVEVALERHVVDAGTLVLLPAGVPHRQYNAGDVTEKHLAIVAPAWEPGQPVDRKVVFSARDADA